MLQQYFRILIRNLSKKSLYSIINYVGLTLSLSAALLIYLWIYDELSYDKMHSDHERIYRMLTFTKDGTEYVKTPSLPLPLAEYLRDEYPQIESATFVKFESPDPLQTGDKTIDVVPAYVDQDFFKIFTGFRFIEGDVEHALKEPNSIILSEKTAKILFGDAPALDQILESNEYSNKSYKVGGVVRIPEHSHIDFGFVSLIDRSNLLYRTFTNNWKRSEWSGIYIKLRKDAQVNDNFIATVNAQFSERAGTAKRVLFQPLANIHLFSDYEWRFDRNLGEYKYLLIYGGLAIAIVVLAMFNFILLTIARASERFNEIGYRKIVGAANSQIFIQYITESFVQIIISMISGLVLVYLLLPFFNHLTGKSIYFIPSFNFIAITFAASLIVSLLAGVYPAFYLSSFNPLLIFKGTNAKGSKNPLIKGLITAQSVVSIFLLIFTVVVYQQIRFINQTDLGISKENIVVVPTGLWYDNDAFKSELLQNSNVLSCSFSTRSPSDFHWQFPLTADGIDTVYGTLYWVDENFAETYDLEVVQGEFLKSTYNDHWNNSKSKQDSKAGENHMISIPSVVNETARDMLHLSDPIGTRLGNNVIVGVVKDFHMRPLQYKIAPLIMVNNPENIMTLNVKISNNNKPETIAYIRQVYSKHREIRGFSYSYFEDELTALYDSEIRLGNMLFSGTILAFTISLMGIFSLASFGTQRRRQEIGIRKINGASVRSILIMLNGDFLKWVLLAFIIAAPVGIYFVNRWLANYAYRAHINWWVVLVIGIITLAVSFLSVSWQCWRASRENPVDVLRHE
jgi:putative ABC transport system permease protein